MNRAEQEAQNRAKLLQLEERAQQALLVREQNKASKSPGFVLYSLFSIIFVFVDDLQHLQELPVQQEF